MTDALTRILIADDHPVFRFGLRALLEAQPDMLVLGEAQSGAEALQMAATLDPDVLLMDVNMPGMNGIEATRKLTQAGERPAVLIFTMFDDDTVFTAMQAGARGYLLKGARGAETLRAIRAVANGEVIISPGVSGQLMRYFTRGARADDDLPFPSLTPREREVLHLLARGLTNAAIAETLVLSPKLSATRYRTSSPNCRLQAAAKPSSRHAKAAQSSWMLPRQTFYRQLTGNQPAG